MVSAFIPFIMGIQFAQYQVKWQASYFGSESSPICSYKINQVKQNGNSVWLTGYLYMTPNFIYVILNNRSKIDLQFGKLLLYLAFNF